MYTLKMTKKQQIQIFEDKRVRTAWDDHEEKWYFSIVDVCGALTDNDYQTARKYWKVLKGRLKKEGNETVTNCYQLKMLAPDGKIRRSTHLILIPTAAEKNENNHIKRIKRLWSLAPPTGRLRISEKRTKLV